MAAKKNRVAQKDSRESSLQFSHGISLYEAATAMSRMERIEHRYQSVLHAAVVACARKDAEELHARLETGEGLELAVLSLPGLWLAAYCEYATHPADRYCDESESDLTLEELHKNLYRDWSTVRTYGFELAKTCWPEDYASEEDEADLVFVDSLQDLVHRRLGMPEGLKRLYKVAP